MAVLLFVNGQWTQVLIDQRVACSAHSGGPLFGRARQNHVLWLPLLEKAYAKHYGSYSAIRYTLEGSSYESISPPQRVPSPQSLKYSAAATSRRRFMTLPGTRSLITTSRRRRRPKQSRMGPCGRACTARREPSPRLSPAPGKGRGRTSRHKNGTLMARNLTYVHPNSHPPLTLAPGVCHRMMSHRPNTPVRRTGC